MCAELHESPEGIGKDRRQMRYRYYIIKEAADEKVKGISLVR